MIGTIQIPILKGADIDHRIVHVGSTDGVVKITQLNGLRISRGEREQCHADAPWIFGVAYSGMRRAGRATGHLFPTPPPTTASGRASRASASRCGAPRFWLKLQGRTWTVWMFLCPSARASVQRS